ncbi:response regulator [Sphingobacterium oryzagri]|uniref:histidine kinase n=1 Tax=Sphingobacterium oryzagri TaxID=3025669 RepID=A0ABY7WL85_9SPHI|nr:hybrid sensor histidine kinase/response regulator transcription factor [Sphingobacterium sp. KACC 22765]WDF69324.1 response regulator [Sphingobacterium sp. KACC 22765]
MHFFFNLRIVSISLLLCMLHAEAQHLRFSSLTEENVFDKQPVLSIAQDVKGKLWFGGENGLFTYDSERITDASQTDSYFKNVGYIIKIKINRHNHLFVATATNFSIYDLTKKCPVMEGNKPFRKKLVVHDIYITDDQIFICAADGLYTIKANASSYQLKKRLNREHIQSIVALGGDRYAITSNAGVEILDYRHNKLSNAVNLDIPIASLKERVMPCIFFENNSLWVASKFQGVFHYDLASKKWTNYNESNSNLLSNNVRKIVKDPMGRLLFGTLKGLSIKGDAAQFHNFKHHARSGNSLNQNSIYDLFIDNQHIVWIGTYFGGINALLPELISLQVYATRSASPFQLNSDIVGSFAESADRYWIGTEEEGVSQMDKKTRHITALPEATTSNLIKDLYVRNGKLYIAQYAGGYAIRDIAKRESRQHSLHSDPHHITNNIYSIYVDAAETIYLGTNRGAFRVKNGQQPTPIPELSQNTIVDMQEDQRKRLYILSNATIFYKDLHVQTFLRDSLGKLAIQGFFIDNQNNLWLTTEESVYKKSVNGTLKRIVTFRDNRLGSPVYHENKLWITSKNGLVYYDIDTKYTSILNQEDGLPVKNLQGAKVFLTKDSSIFIATLNGLVSFVPRNVRFNKIVPTVILRNISVNESALSAARILEDSDDNAYHITLAHDENIIAIDFSSSNFIKPLKNRFRYKLEGFDKDWIETNTGKIRYTNISEGKHTLLIYASNNDMIWSKQAMKILLTIRPPLWKTWWAYLLYAALVTIAIHFLIKFIVERKVFINSKKEYENKIKFFTQVSHEIRTPLTLITAPLDDIINETAGQSETQQKVRRIKKNAHKLLAIINELLDFKRFDDKKQQLRKTEVSLKEYIEDNFYLLHDLALSKNIHYYIRQLDTVGTFWLDVQQFDKVIFNLLSNALKYTPSGGTVYLELIDTVEGIEIHVVDNGIGVLEENQFKIFEEYYREAQTEDVIGTGIGLALSKEIVERHQGEIYCNTLQQTDGRWTKFTVRLKKEQQVDHSLYTHLTESVPLPTVNAYSKHEPHEVILLVEDNNEMRDLLVSLFAEHYTVITAHDGAEALEKARLHLPDIILSDIMMPKMSGIELCQAVKTDVKTSHIPFVLLTAVNDATVQLSTLTYGANLYLVKPFEQKHLFLSIYNLLQVSKQNRENFRVKTLTSSNETDNKFIATLDELIEGHLLSENFDVDFISKQMGMSPPILYRKLKAISNLSLNNYVKTYRLTKAKQLLKTDLNISEVAYAVGFSDRKYFSKEFKKHFGMTPSAYVANER